VRILTSFFGNAATNSRLGIALLLCYLRYPGRVLGADEMPPATLVSFIARQLGVNPAAFTKYSQRDRVRNCLRASDATHDEKIYEKLGTPLDPFEQFPSAINQ
jgi:hypothetical protein